MTRRKDGTYQQQMAVVENGRKRQVYFYGKTKAEVLRKIAAYKEKEAIGPLFSAVADEWWEQHEPTLAHNSIHGYQVAHRRVVEYFGETPLRQLRPLDIDRCISSLVREHHMAHKTAANHLIVLKQIFRYAIRSGYTDTNPTTDITVPRGLSHTPRELPGTDDIQRIKDSVTLPFGLFAYMGLYTGLRLGELLALRWEDVDLAAGVIHVHHSLYWQSGRPAFKAPKTAAGVRRVPILARLEPYLQPGTGYIFHHEGQPLTARRFRTAWNHYLRDSGITCTTHQLRHLYTTMLYEQGIAVKDAQRLLGHAQASTTQDIYTHIRAQREVHIHDALYHVDIM